MSALKGTLAIVEREEIVRSLRICRFQRDAAKRLGIDETTLFRKMIRHEISEEEVSQPFWLPEIKLKKAA